MELTLLVFLAADHHEALPVGRHVVVARILSKGIHFETLLEQHHGRFGIRDHDPGAGFGGAAFLTLLVPGLNFLMLPALVVGGTLLVLRQEPNPS